jgi:opacity protein-like surface antigen
MSRACACVFLLFAAALPALAADVRPDAPEADFREFNRRFAMAAYNYPRHGAAPLGLIGFDVYADAAVDQDFGDEDFVGTVLDDDLTGDVLVVGRVGARKGLPGGINIGLSYGSALETDIKLISGELQWAIIEGGTLSPALSLRLTGTRTMGSDVYDLDQYGAEILLSKGFTVVTPYVGAGVVRSEGSLDSSLGRTFEDSQTRGVIYGGVTVSLLLPKITVEVEKADVVQGAVRIAFGL